MDERLKRFARSNRKQMNEAETLLWSCLRRKAAGHRFRRQRVIGPYIVDFVCLRCRLVLEVDGSQHADSVYDDRRDAFLRSEGFRVVRVWSWEVLGDLDMVLATCLAESCRSTRRLFV